MAGASRDFKEVKQKLLFQLTNRGQPVIEVEDANYQNRSELLLRHLFDGVELDERYGKATLTNLFNLWKRPVHIVTQRKDRAILMSFDGKEHSEGGCDVAA